MNIQRFDKRPGCSRLVIHNGVAYFTGHSAVPGFKTLKEQTAAVLKRYDELLPQFGLKKENIIMMNIYLKNVNDLPDFAEVRRGWLPDEYGAAGVAVQANLTGENNLLELALIVAVE